MNLKYLILLPLLLFTKKENFSNNKFEAFDNLNNKTWMAEGNWRDNTKFKQEITFKYDLNKSIIICKSKGFTNMEQTQYGERNHGIRQYDSKLDKIRFWEFDVFGSVTEGIVECEGKDIIYQYNYQGTNLTDMWQYVNDSLYNFKVGIYKNKKWERIFLSTHFKQVH